MKVVLDTNVIVSAVLWSGKTSKLIPLIKENRTELCFSQETFLELVDVISRPEFAERLVKTKTSLRLILDEVILPNSVFSPLKKNLPNILSKDPTDDKFIHLAVLAKAKYIVSGDKALLELKKYKSVRIVSVEEFLKIRIK